MLVFGLCATVVQIRDALDAFVCFRPDLGYIQGMSFLAAMVCLYCDTPYVGDVGGRVGSTRCARVSLLWVLLFFFL